MQLKKWAQEKQGSIRSSCNTDVQLGTRTEWEDSVILLPCTLLHSPASYFTSLWDCWDVPSPARVKCWDHFVQLIPSYVTLFPPTLPTLFGDTSANFSCCFWVSSYCTKQTQLQSLAFGFSPVLHPGLCPGSSEMLPSSPLPAACFPIISSPKHSFPKAYSATHTSPFFYLIAHFYSISPIEFPFFSLPCETCHKQLLPASVPFSSGLEMDTSFHSFLF